MLGNEGINISVHFERGIRVSFYISLTFPPSLPLSLSAFHSSCQELSRVSDTHSGDSHNPKHMPPAHWFTRLRLEHHMQLHLLSSMTPHSYCMFVSLCYKRHHTDTISVSKTLTCPQNLTPSCQHY